MNRTVTVEGSMALVTYDRASYCDTPVYLHAPGEPYYRGQIIGFVGSMAGHGTLIHLGMPEGNSLGPTTGPAATWAVGHISRREAVQDLTGWHLGQVPTNPAWKLHIPVNA